MASVVFGETIMLRDFRCKLGRIEYSGQIRCIGSGEPEIYLYQREVPEEIRLLVEAQIYQSTALSAEALVTTTA